MAGLTEGKTIDDCRRDIATALVNALDVPLDVAQSFLYEYEEKLYAEWAATNAGQLLSRIQQDGYSAHDKAPTGDAAERALRDTGEAGSPGVSVSVEPLRDDAPSGTQPTPDSGRPGTDSHTRQVGFAILELDDRSEIETYAGAVPLSLHVYGAKVRLFILENPDAAMVRWTVYAVPNYEQSKSIYRAHYLGSAYVSGSMWHFFYRPVTG